MRVAYADPPYIGQARRHYGDDPQCAEVDHNQLLADLATFDAWALSASSSSLYTILRLPNCPPDVRIAAWVKPFAVYKPGVNPAYTWEPLLYQTSWTGKRDEDRARDSVIENAQMRSLIVGQKPRRFCYWLFILLGMQPGDQFIDMFPGSGAVSRAWGEYCISQRDLVEQQPLIIEISS